MLTQSGGNWTFNTLYDFQGGHDGCNSLTQLKAGPKVGTWIGATYYGGSQNSGTIFKLAEAGGVWSETPVYTFTGGTDGRNPYDLDAVADGSTIFGVAPNGGPFGYGVVFELIPKRNKFDYVEIQSFRGGSDGANPMGIRIDNQTGALNGTTSNGGVFGRGTVFTMVSNGGKSWTKKILHSFGSGSDGAYPTSRTMLDQTTGKLYGTTPNGGTNNGGIVYEITP